jgi:hypothetical protein
MEKAITRFKETPQGKDVDFEVLLFDSAPRLHNSLASFDGATDARST